MALLTESRPSDGNSKLHKKITVKLIADSNIPNKSLMSGDDIAEALVELSHVRLDRHQISRIDNLECLGPVTNLYLQQNRIDCIENLEVLTNLRFLTLAGNRIKKIQNLKVLKQLKFLDLSFNFIENCNTGSSGISRQSLNHQINFHSPLLYYQGNPCTNNEGYRNTVTQALTNLKELDEIPVRKLEDRKYSSNSSAEDSSSCDEECDVENPDDYKEDTDSKCCAEDIIARVKIRSMKQTEQHNERIRELLVSEVGAP